MFRKIFLAVAVACGVWGFSGCAEDSTSTGGVSEGLQRFVGTKIFRDMALTDSTLTGNLTLAADTSTRFLRLNPSGGHRNVTLPAFAGNQGLWYYIINSGSGNNLVVKNAAGSTIVTIAQSQVAFVCCSATAWNGAAFGASFSGALAADGSVVGGTGQAQDFGSNGIKADVVAESTTATGVTLDGVLLKDYVVSSNALGALDASLGIDGKAGAGGGAGGDVVVTAGAGHTNGNGGVTTAAAGAAAGSGTGGTATLIGGAAADGGTGTGGIAAVTGGSAGTTTNGAGGEVDITGGAGRGNQVGGAIVAAGGRGGATGIGGAVTATSGAGGSTSGASGALTLATGTTTTGSGSATGNVLFQSGAGAASAAAVAAGASGTVTVRSQAGGANTGAATGQVGGAGGAVALVGGAGGATNSTGAHNAGAGAAVAITGGAGGAASAGTGNGGAGGAITVTSGAGGATTGGTAGVAGEIAVVGGAGSGAGAGAGVTITPGAGGATGTGGALALNSGASAGVGGTAGNVSMDTGAATGGIGGTITIGGTNATTTTVGRSGGTTTLAGTVGGSFGNTGLKILDTGGDHTLNFTTGTNEAGNYTVTVPDLAGSDTLVTLATTQTMTGAKTFPNTGLKVLDAGSDHALTFTTATDEAGSYTVTVPDLAGNDTFVMLGCNQTFSGNNIHSGTLTVGNVKLLLLDTGGDHYTNLKQNSNEGANRTLNIPALGADDTLMTLGVPGTVTGTLTLASAAGKVVRTAQRYRYAGGWKVGSAAGFVVAAADNVIAATCPQSQTAAILIVPIPALKVGSIITAYGILGQIESGGNQVTIDGDLRVSTAAAADFTDASVATMTQIVANADTKVDSTQDKASLTQTVAQDEMYYVKITVTTNAACDVDIRGVTLVISEQ
jgi:hypothetical protein